LAPLPVAHVEHDAQAKPARRGAQLGSGSVLVLIDRGDAVVQGGASVGSHAQDYLLLAAEPYTARPNRP
jgi:hypothetical protein